MDFAQDPAYTPRFIRPRTKVDSRPKSKQSEGNWLDSDSDDDVKDKLPPCEVPLDTFVDEPRLPNAFAKVRDLFTVSLDEHNDDMHKLALLMEALVLEREVNTVQRLQLKKDESHNSVLNGNVATLRREYEEFVRESEETVDVLYADVTFYQNEIEVMAGEKMQEMFKLSRLKQELEMKVEEVARLSELKEKTIAANEGTRKKSEALQVRERGMRERATRERDTRALFAPPYTPPPLHSSCSLRRG